MKQQQQQKYKGTLRIEHLPAHSYRSWLWDPTRGCYHSDLQISALSEIEHTVVHIHYRLTHHLWTAFVHILSINYLLQRSDYFQLTPIYYFSDMVAEINSTTAWKVSTQILCHICPNQTKPNTIRMRTVIALWVSLTKSGLSKQLAAITPHWLHQPQQVGRQQYNLLKT